MFGMKRLWEVVNNMENRVSVLECDRERRVNDECSRLLRDELRKRGCLDVPAAAELIEAKVGYAHTMGPVNQLPQFIAVAYLSGPEQYATHNAHTCESRYPGLFSKEFAQ